MGTSRSNASPNSSLNEGFNPKASNKHAKTKHPTLKTLQPSRSFFLNHIYQTFKYNSTYSNKDDKNNKNILLYTIPFNPTGHSFISLSKDLTEKAECNVYKSSETQLFVSYNRGIKQNDLLNKDKFYFLVDGGFEVYCLIDGHGPFGDLVGQIVQDKVFLTLNENYSTNFENQYEEIFIKLFEDIHSNLINQNIELVDEYDAYLSGAAVTIIIIKDNVLYTVNIGNVMGLLIHNDYLHMKHKEDSETNINTSKFEVDLLTIDDSDLFNEFFEKSSKFSKDEFDFLHLHGLFDINEEIRRIYENGGEIRQIAGESKGRIFVQGKYYPGVINTRGLGDQIGEIIGVMHKPHIAKMKIKNDVEYYLILCTDGVGGFGNVEKILEIFKEHLGNMHFALDAIIHKLNQKYYGSRYVPDMTLMIKKIYIKENK